MPRVGFFAIAALLALSASTAPAAEETQRVILADFEDVGTWRLTSSRGLAPGAWFAGNVFFGGSRAAVRHGEHGGEIRFVFDEGEGPWRMGFIREKMRRVGGFIDGIEFEADARDHESRLGFVLIDSADRSFSTAPVVLSGSGWRRHRLEVNAATVKDFAEIQFPVRVDRVAFESARGGAGSVYLDDIAATGRFTRSDALAIRPLYQGIAHDPEMDVVVTYRILNARREPVECVVRWTVSAAGGERLLEREQKVSVPATGEAKIAFRADRLPVGAYEALVRAKHAGTECTYEDTFGVFRPNNSRPNRSAMWFGIQDINRWQTEDESRLHMEWMKALGVDINRLGAIARNVIPDNPLALDGWRRMINLFDEAGVDLLIGYFETPPWLAPVKGDTSAANVRSAPTDLKAFEAYAEEYGRFFSRFKPVRYVEFWNEPDISFFNGTYEEYRDMLAAFSRGMRRSAPGVKIGTGGVTVLHPREKEGFSSRMFQELGDNYDVAFFHAHGTFANSVERQGMVENWLAKAGLDKKIANTESGERSRWDAAGRHRQAIALIKKLTYSKSRPASEFYIWYTLQDVWDMDPSESVSSFGLVTSDNRAKPSFVAYNELIRRLANTRPFVVEAPDDVTVHGFTRDDGNHVYVAWPAGARASAALRLRSASPISVIGMFGREAATLPRGATQVWALSSEPVYLETKTLLAFVSEDELPLRAPAEVYRDSAAPTSFDSRLTNRAETSLSGKVKLLDSAGALVWQQDVSVSPRGELAVSPIIPPVSGEAPPTARFTLTFEPAGEEVPAVTLPILAAHSHSILRVPPGTFEARMKVLPAIRLDKHLDAFELSFDPAIPAWKGPEDLSVETRLAHDGVNLLLRLDVADDRHVQNQETSELWRGDSVQLAFYDPASKTHTTLTLALTDAGPRVWRNKGADGVTPGLWEVPVKIRRAGARTLYELSLPLDALGYSSLKDTQPLRFGFLVNEDDGQGRVRWMQWFGGLGKSQNIDELGYGILK